MLRLRVPEMTEQNGNCSRCGDGGGSAPGCRGRSHKVAVDGYKVRYRYQIQIRMQIHMHVERRTEIQIQLQVHLYQTLFESQGIGTKYTCRHIYVNTFRFLDSQGRIRFPWRLHFRAIVILILPLRHANEHVSFPEISTELLGCFAGIIRH